MPTLDRQDNVFVLDLGDGEHRFHPYRLASVDAALDEVEKAQGPRAEVAAATGRFYSNGLDLEWLDAHADQHENCRTRVHGLFARVLSLAGITVATLQGHPFAAGAMFPSRTTSASCVPTVATGACPRPTSASGSRPAWPPSSSRG